MTVAKDEVLADLALQANVAQFVSFSPGGSLRFVRLREPPPDEHFPDASAAIEALFGRASYGTVNVRTFSVDDAAGDGKGRAFHYGIATVDDALALIRRHGAEGLHSIVNETIPVDDGGVSGVALGGILEFSPDDTPRCVDKPGTVALPYEEGMRLLETVYGFRPEIEPDSGQRLEWSIHPRRVGLRHTHTLVWELEQVRPRVMDAPLTWPNNLSRMLGDKTFGLLIADLLGAAVPRTVVINRRVAPFPFGQPSGLGERWLRTAPAEPVPGRYPTTFGWQDPFILLERDDPEHEVATVLAQDAVDAAYSGALLPGQGEDFVIEGVHGRGDEFMLGNASPENLPSAVVDAVAEVARGLAKTLGPVRIEWAMDGSGVWVLQLQQASPMSGGATIVEGTANRWHEFDPATGLDALRRLISEVEGTGEGVVLRGNIGVTSHFGDLLRRAAIPSRVELSPVPGHQAAVSGQPASGGS